MGRICQLLFFKFFQIFYELYFINMVPMHQVRMFLLFYKQKEAVNHF
jgi:hypothetical protein